MRPGLCQGLALVAGCGDGDGGVVEEAAKEAASNPDAAVTGFEAESPAKMKRCLEKEGLIVRDESSIPEDLKETTGITDQLTITSDAGGAGNYVYAGEDLDEAAGAIRSCL